MTYDIQTALKGFKQITNLVSPEVRKSKITDLIRANINSGNKKTNINLMYWGHISVTRAMGKSVGHALAELVAKQDESGALGLLNDNPRIRDRWGHGGRTSVADWFNEIFPDAPEVFSCEDCMALEYDDDGFWAHDGNEHICESCINDNYTWSENSGTYITNEEFEEEQEELEQQQEDDSVIGGLSLQQADSFQNSKFF